VQVIQADRPLRPGLRTAQDRQQQSGENSYNGNHDQQLDQCESFHGSEIVFHTGLDIGERGKSRRLTIQS
jgi:hypothetical protein